MDLINKDNMERQISEMWDAVNDIPGSDPDRDTAINNANEAERKSREAYRKQEALRNAAPEMLALLKSIKFNAVRCSENGYLIPTNSITDPIDELIKKIQA
jgi:hypothetical protein